MVGTKQIDMDDVDDPIHEVQQYFTYEYQQFTDTGETFIFEFAPDEFYDNNDEIGFLASEKEPFQFLQLQNHFSRSKALPDQTGKPPYQVFDIVLSNKKNTFERTFYTFFGLLGDIGGFNSAIIIFPAFLMNFYASRMFKAQVSSGIPIRKTHKMRDR